MDPLALIQTIVTALSDQNLVSKFIIILFLVVYNLFAVLMTRQISTMTTIIDQIHFTGFFKTLGYLHLAFSIILLFFIIIVI